MNVRYKTGKTEMMGRKKELDILDLEDRNIEVIELRYTAVKRIRISEQICGFQDYFVRRNRNNEVIDIKGVNDVPITFYPDERGVGYGYMVKTRRNMHLLAGILKDKQCKPTDAKVLKELENIQDKMHFVKEINLRDTSLDGVLIANKTKAERTLARNEALKEQIRIAQAEKENDELEKELKRLQAEDAKGDSADTKTKVDDTKKPADTNAVAAPKTPAKPADKK